ncbi:hypothetical protein BJ138DRAFT_1155043 [Hygrophoropsis aurantiaca]|uniref:Uncharacterized protein n=1 Tax=Hygrophoropsis aurantiaca TaxID=72124 RepID=A0ACB8A8Z0_9AGAM|nr:hypothetical protein BJ138DRAFT_1155043 [Hygrophoropsis aurantiaca]
MGIQTGEQDPQASTRTTIKVIEDEVLELEKHECDLLARLHRLQDTIARKRALAANLKNSFVPIHRLPNEVLLACFQQAVHDWLSKMDGEDERMIPDSESRSEYDWECTPVFAITHVSHRWRQLAINMPSLWTTLVIKPKFARHLDVFRDFLSRVKHMPITANFRRFSYDDMESSVERSLLRAMMPLMHAQQITALTLLSPGRVLASLRSRLAKKPFNVLGPPSPYLNVFSRLTVLSIFGIEEADHFNLGHLARLLSAAPQLKTLELYYDPSIDPDFDSVGHTVISLPMLEHLTIMETTAFTWEFLGLLFAPNVCQVKFLNFGDHDTSDISSLFLNNDDTFNVKVPRFPKVWNLTLSWAYYSGDLNTDLIGAFPRVTHLTMRNPVRFLDTVEPRSPEPTTFQWLRHLTLDFSFEYAYMDPRGCFNWLPVLKDQADHPLLISIFDSSTPSLRKHADGNLFRYCKKLQQYGKLDERSSRLDRFLCWQANGEPAM